MPDTVHHVMWYTVYDAKTGDLIAIGTTQKKKSPPVRQHRQAARVDGI